MKRLFITVGFGLAFFGATAQTASPELVSSAGDSFSNSTYLLDWSIGESVTATLSAGTYVITQGFKQSSYDITTNADLTRDVKISVFPNPATDFISVDFKSSLQDTETS